MQGIKQDQQNDNDLNSAATTATSPLQEDNTHQDGQSQDEEGLPIGLIPNSLGEGEDGAAGDQDDLHYLDLENEA